MTNEQTPASASDERSTSSNPSDAATYRATVWYKDVAKVIGVLGFVVSMFTVIERFWVRSEERTQARLEALRAVTGQLADVQAEYLEMVARAPANLYALGVAKNTKRQMLIQTANSLIADPDVRAQAGPVVFAELANEMSSDGRYEEARVMFEEALKLADNDLTTKVAVLRTLGGLYGVANTKFQDPGKSRDYFEQALGLLDRRNDDAGKLAWAETKLQQANMEIVYGAPGKAKSMASDAKSRIDQVRAASPLKTQLENIANAIMRGEQYGQTQESTKPVGSTTTSGPAPGAAVVAAIEMWAPIPGQVSGAEMVVAIDGASVGKLSNLQANRTLQLPPLTTGIHRLSLSQIAAYYVDPVNGPRPSSAGMTCNTLFELQQGKSKLHLNVGGGAGGVLCAAD